MIGGHDVYLKTPDGASALDCALRTVRLFWPKAVFENAVTAELLPQYRQVAFAQVREILAYQDLSAFRKWEQLGADPSLHGTMIHLLASPNELALVIDDHPAAQIAEIVQSIRHALRFNPFGAVKAREAA